MKKTIFMYVANGGDGSAITSFYEEEILAEILEALEDEPFGESSATSITFESESPISISGITVHNRAEVIKDLEEELAYQNKWKPGSKKSACLKEAIAYLRYERESLDMKWIRYR